jgi:hypothetical protein
MTAEMTANRNKWKKQNVASLRVQILVCVSLLSIFLFVYDKDIRVAEDRARWRDIEKAGPAVDCSKLMMMMMMKDIKTHFTKDLYSF